MDKLLKETINFHGHLCPGISFGYRATCYALKLLGLEGKNIGETHLVIAENDVCGLDAIQFVTGCTIGNDGLIINNVGKQAFSFINKKTGKGIRVMLNVPLWKSAEPLRLHKLVKTGMASSEEKEQFFSVRTKRGGELLEIPEEDLLKVSEIEKEIPKKPRLYPNITCSSCKEQVMEVYIQKMDGDYICLSCKNNGK